MTSVTTRLKFILGCFPREIPLTEICYSVPSIFFVFLDDEAMLHQEFQPIVDSSETDVHIIPGGEIIVDGRRFERQTGIIEQFKNRVIVFPIHPLYTRAHLTRKSAVTRLEVPFMFTDYTFRRSLLHCMVQKFIILQSYVRLNDDAPGSERVHNAKTPGLPEPREPGASSEDCRMQSYELQPDKITGTTRHSAVESAAPRSLAGSHGAGASETTAEHAHTEAEACAGGGRRVGV
jgi:hypothetical protein